MRIILVGYGVVGQSLTRLFVIRRAELAKNYGFRPRVVAIADSGGVAINQKGLDLEKILQVKSEKRTIAADSDYGCPYMSVSYVIQSVESEVLVEISPTNIKNGEPALSYIKDAFRTGKHVVTANKGPLALALPVLIELSEYNKVFLRFSGSVGAGTPILDFAKKCLYGEKIISIRGVLNGTTNYILTEMTQKRVPFDEVLEKAKKLGYAETDPSIDINGIDTACKIVILANWALGKRVTLKDVQIKGIRDVTMKEIEEADKNNCFVKLVGTINDELKVKPENVSKESPLAVSGTLNAVTFTSEFAGEQTIIGRGAGGVETASAILRDLLDIKEKLAAKVWL